jgi:hypothetical protein
VILTQNFLESGKMPSLYLPIILIGLQFTFPWNCSLLLSLRPPNLRTPDLSSLHGEDLLPSAAPFLPEAPIARATALFLTDGNFFSIVKEHTVFWTLLRHSVREKEKV